MIFILQDLPLIQAKVPGMRMIVISAMNVIPKVHEPGLGSADIATGRTEEGKKQVACSR
jgi:hypothetical protein